MIGPRFYIAFGCIVFVIVLGVLAMKRSAAVQEGAFRGTPISVTGGSARAFDIPLDDGRTVTCVVWQDNYKGGISCDWASAK